MTKHTTARASAAVAIRPPFELYTAALRRMQNDLPPAPVALLDITSFRANAADMVRRAAGTPIRVASKSLRIRTAIETALAQPGYAGVMAFTLAEALWLRECGHTDLLVAYPPWTTVPWVPGSAPPRPARPSPWWWTPRNTSS